MWEKLAISPPREASIYLTSSPFPHPYLSIVSWWLFNLSKIFIVLNRNIFFHKSEYIYFIIFDELYIYNTIGLNFSLFWRVFSWLFTCRRPGEIVSLTFSPPSIFTPLALHLPHMHVIYVLTLILFLLSTTDFFLKILILVMIKWISHDKIFM